MFRFFKYFVYFLIFFSFILFYLIFTPLGNQTLYSLISQKISQKAGLYIQVKSIKIKSTTDIQIVMNIEKKAKLTLRGILNDALIDMDYQLNSECIASDMCTIDDDIDIKGHINGPFTRMNVMGKGKALDGNVTYSAIKFIDKVENLNLVMHDVNSSKLFNLMGQNALIKGKADATAQFSLMDENHKKGSFTYAVVDNNFSGIPLTLHTKVDIEDMDHTFTIDMLSPALQLNISKGHYQQDKKIAHAFYLLDIKDLSALENILGYKYLGAFYARGELHYDKYITINGLSKSYGGLLDFIFKKDKLHVKLNNIAFQDMMKIFPYQPMIIASALGTIDYDFIQKTLDVNTQLNNAKFVHTKLVDIIRNKSGVNLLTETFNDNSLVLSYHDKIILADLKLVNDYSHIYISNTKLDIEKNEINAYFDFQMQKQEFLGKVYGPIDDPEVNLNLQRLIKYQMNKQLDAMMGRNNRKMMDMMPMTPVAKDMATEMGASFIKIFF